MPPDGDDIFADDFLCVICGYSLRGLPHTGNCPECGTPLARSLHGDRLRYSDRNWFKRVQTGTRIFSASFAVLCVSWISFVLGLIVAYQLGFRKPATEQAFELAFALCFISALLMMLLGIWWLTTQEPRDLMREIPGSDRRLARFAMVVAALLGLITITKPTFIAAYVLIGCVAPSWVTAMLLGAYFGLRHVRSLAGRLSDAALVQRCETHSRIMFWVAGCFAACSVYQAVTYSIPRFRVAPAGAVMYAFLALGSIGLIMLIKTAMTFNRFLRALRWISTQQHP